MKNLPLELQLLILRHIPLTTVLAVVSYVNKSMRLSVGSLNSADVNLMLKSHTQPEIIAAAYFMLSTLPADSSLTVALQGIVIDSISRSNPTMNRLPFIALAKMLFNATDSNRIAIQIRLNGHNHKAPLKYVKHNQLLAEMYSQKLREWIPKAKSEWVFRLAALLSSKDVAEAHLRVTQKKKLVYLREMVEADNVDMVDCILRSITNEKEQSRIMYQTYHSKSVEVCALLVQYGKPDATELWTFFNQAVGRLGMRFSQWKPMVDSFASDCHQNYTGIHYLLKQRRVVEPEAIKYIIDRGMDALSLANLRPHNNDEYCDNFAVVRHLLRPHVPDLVASFDLAVDGTLNDIVAMTLVKPELTNMLCVVAARFGRKNVVQELTARDTVQFTAMASQTFAGNAALSRISPNQLIAAAIFSGNIEMHDLCFKWLFVDLSGYLWSVLWRYVVEMDIDYVEVFIRHTRLPGYEGVKPPQHWSTADKTRFAAAISQRNDGVQQVELTDLVSQFKRFLATGDWKILSVQYFNFYKDYDGKWVIMQDDNNKCMLDEQDVLIMLQQPGAKSVERYRQICKLYKIKSNAPAIMFLLEHYFTQPKTVRVVAIQFWLLRQLEKRCE